MKEDKSKKNNKYIGLIIFIILIFAMGGGYYYFSKFKDKGLEKEEVKKENKLSPYRIAGNGLENFDLYFLQLENEKKNKVYSPLSIKYALNMLALGANGETKDQIANIIGDYVGKKYINSKNMSFANAMFIRESYKKAVKEAYLTNLSNKYNAEVIYDSFESVNTINSWVQSKTFDLVNNLVDDLSNIDYMLVNALAIDMEWINKIQAEDKDYIVHYEHEKYYQTVDSLISIDYHGLEFENVSKKAKSVMIAADINKYDIVKELGEDSIRSTVGKEYDDWKANGACGDESEILDTNVYLDKYIDEINNGYKQISKSTDFYFYDDSSIKAFAKDLKEYDGTTLQYVGIMPKNDSLDSYIKNLKASDLNKVISNLRDIKLDNFKEGVITSIEGYIPMFKMDYELDLLNDLKKLGILNVFDPEKADLANLTSSKSYINKAQHKAMIEFSNDGIKAAAVTDLGGKGAAGCWFDYLYEVPVEKIDLTFNKPYLFLVRDKKTGEVWFTGTVYEPLEHIEHDLY